jgi:hypothetical protein
MKKGEPIPFVGWIDDKEDTESMLREQIHAQQNRIDVLEANHKIQLNINEKALQYIVELEQGLKASIDLNKAQALRNTQKDDFDMDGRC